MKTNKKRTKYLSLIALTLFMFVAIFVSSMVGVTSFSFSDIITMVTEKLGISESTSASNMQNTILESQTSAYSFVLVGWCCIIGMWSHLSVHLSQSPYRPLYIRHIVGSITGGCHFHTDRNG